MAIRARWQLDRQGRVVKSEVTNKLLGLPPIHHAREILWQRIHPEDRDAARHAVDRAVREETCLRFEIRMLCADGEWRKVSFTGVPHYEHNRFTGIIGLAECRDCLRDAATWAGVIHGAELWVLVLCVAAVEWF